MPRAVWNGITVAESDDIVVVEGNHYFPRSSVRSDVLRESSTHTVCPWKGIASYYTLEHEGTTSTNAAWYYPHPLPPARRIRNRIAFWKDVRVEA